MEAQNISLIKSLLDKFLAGDAQGYIDGCHEDFYGKIWSGLIPGGDEIKGKPITAQNLCRAYKQLGIDGVEALAREAVKK